MPKPEIITKEMFVGVGAKDPTEITQAAREVISSGKRITDLLITRVLFEPHTTGVLLITAPAHEKHGLGGMEIPNQTRPHKIYESLQPEEGPIDGVNRI